MVHGLRQRFETLGIVEQIVLNIGIARDDPQIAQHLEQHARRTAGLAGAAQFIQRRPQLLAQKAHHDLAIGERGVVVGNFADACGGHGSRCRIISRTILASGKTGRAGNIRAGLQQLSLCLRERDDGHHDPSLHVRVMVNPRYCSIERGVEHSPGASVTRSAQSVLVRRLMSSSQRCTTIAMLSSSLRTAYLRAKR